MHNNQIFTDLIAIYNSSRESVQTIFKYNLLNDFICYLDSSKNTLLHNIVSNNDKCTLKLFINFLTKNNFTDRIIDSQNINGDTALHIAVRNNYFGLAKILDNAGINKTIKNKNNEYVEDNTNNLKSNISNKHMKCISKLCNDPSCNTHTKQYQSQSPLEKVFDRLDTLSATSGSNIQPLNVVRLDNERLNLHDKYNYQSPTSNNSKRDKSVLNNIDDDSLTLSNEFLRMLINGLEKSKNNTTGTRRSILFGGKNSKKSSKTSKPNSKRSLENKASKIHDSIVKHFLDELKCSIDDAKALKAALYNIVKTEFPTLNNLDRAEKMNQLMKDNKIMKQVKSEKNEYLKIIETAKQNKSNKPDKPLKTSKPNEKKNQKI